MRKRLFLAAGAASALLGVTAALPAAAAAARAPVPGRSAAAVTAGAVPADTAPSATFLTAAGGMTGVTCTASTLTLVAGTAANTFSLTVWTFGSCTSNIKGVTSVKSVGVQNLPYSVTVNPAAAPPTFTVTAGAAGNIQFTFALNTDLGTVMCAYQPNGGAIAGTTNAGVTAVTFTNVQFNLTSGSALCPKNIFFSASYA
jgi:hypothetical protein